MELLRDLWTYCTHYPQHSHSTSIKVCSRTVSGRAEVLYKQSKTFRAVLQLTDAMVWLKQNWKIQSHTYGKQSHCPLVKSPKFTDTDEFILLHTEFWSNSVAFSFQHIWLTVITVLLHMLNDTTKSTLLNISENFGISPSLSCGSWGEDAAIQVYYRITMPRQTSSIQQLLF